MKEWIRDFVEFIRLKICIFVCAIGLSGYLMFNILDERIAFVVLASFMIAAGSYSFNNIMDKGEDLINRSKLNSFVINNKALLIVFACFSLGVVFSLFLSFYSIIFSLLGVITSLHYSFFKVKKYLLVKNLYTALGASLVFLVGATRFNVEIFWNYLLISFFVAVISMISDLRDYKGDKFSHIKTLPVFLGFGITKRIIFVLLGIFSLLILFLSNLFALLPFVFFIFYFLYRNNPQSAHFYGGISFVFLTLFLIVRGL